MMFPRVLLALAAVFVGTPGLAASTADRSPFAQGQWWDPVHSGSGFEIFSVADLVAVVWFTYTDAGRPVWYTAQGRADGLGAQAWPLLQHTWTNGARGNATVVGSLRLDVRAPESASVHFDVHGKRGTWAIQPLILSGTINELDRSGAWFDPGNSGWGLSLSEQGDVAGGILYTYDTSGTATWAAGFHRGGLSNLAFQAYSGACPTCAYHPPVGSSVGTLSIDARSETDATVHSALSLPMAVGVRLDGARIAQLGRPASQRAADRQLASFHDGLALHTHLAAGLMNVPAWSSGGSFSAGSPGGFPFSLTNLQESGVDEADLVKSNGVHVYTYAHDSNGVPLWSLRVAKVGDDGATLDVRGTVPLRNRWNTTRQTAGLFLHGDNLVSVAGTQASTFGPAAWSMPGPWTNGTTLIEVLSIANPDVPVTRWQATIDGHVVSSRRIGDRVYVVSRFVPSLSGFIYGATYGPAVAANQEVLARTPLTDLLPKVSINDGALTSAVSIDAVFAPPQGSRRPMADMMLVTAIDLTVPRIAQTLAIVGSVEAIYASTTNLFLAGSRYEARDPFGLPLPADTFLYLTDIHQIRLGADAMSIVGSGTVEGFLGHDVDKAAFRLSEYQGKLRAVTSSQMWGTPNRNRLTILEPSTLAPGLLKTVAYLPNAKRPEPIGKPNEILFGTRFLNDRLYAVTFKQTDPLYVVDLADPADPKIKGALEIPGFSDYLHPLPNGLLLGFGKDAVPASTMGDGQFAWYQGLHLTLFDVSNADQPREIQRLLMGKRGSESALLKSHHAFSALMQSDGSGTFGIPASIHDGPHVNDPTHYYPWQHSGLMRFELRGTTPSDARLVQLIPTLVTHSATQFSGPFHDVSRDGARSVLFRNGTVYVGNGKFWRQDAAGRTFGPF